MTETLPFSGGVQVNIPAAALSRPDVARWLAGLIQALGRNGNGNGHRRATNGSGGRPTAAAVDPSLDPIAQIRAALFPTYRQLLDLVHERGELTMAEAATELKKDRRRVSEAHARIGETAGRLGFRCPIHVEPRVGSYIIRWVGLEMSAA